MHVSPPVKNTYLKSLELKMNEIRGCLSWFKNHVEYIL